MRGIPSRVGSSSTRAGSARAQSAPLAVMLVFAMIIAGSTLVVVIGGTAITETQSNLDTQRAENTMTQLDSQAAMVAIGSSQTQSIELESQSGGAYSVRNASGWMNVSYENTSSGGVTTVYNESMGAIVYESGESTIAYQGGGVWKARSGGSVMVSPPEFHYRNATLTLPMVQVNGSDSIDRRAGITKHSSKTYYPNTSVDGKFANPLTDGKVNITVQSKYYEGWGEYFEQRTDGEVSYTHPRNRATLTLVSPVDTKTIQSASSSLSAAGNFELQGTAHNECGPDVYANSYNSTDTSDGYCAQSPGDEGDIIYGNNVDISNGAGGSDIRGDLISGGNVEVGTGGGKPTVYGNISYTNSCNPSVSACQDRIASGSGGTLSQVSGIQEASPINSLIQNKADAVRSSADNDVSENITGSNELDYAYDAPTDTVELSSGTYYIKNISPSGGETVLLNTTEGDITIVVEENIHLADGATIEVIGDGVVNVYVEGTGGHSTHLDMEKKTEIANDGDDAPQFRVYGQDNFTASIGEGAAGNPARFVGAIYAPPGNGGTGRVDIDGGIMYGGVLTGTTTVDGGSIHYDESLSRAELMSRDDKVVKLTYLHISINRINVSSG